MMYGTSCKWGLSLLSQQPHDCSLLDVGNPKPAGDLPVGLSSAGHASSPGLFFQTHVFISTTIQFTLIAQILTQYSISYPKATCSASAIMR